MARRMFDEDEELKVRRKKGSGEDEAEFIRKTMDMIEKRRRKIWKPSEGVNLVRILPGNGSHFFVEVPQHFNVGPEKSVVVCRKAINEPCPVCKAIEKWSSSQDVEKQKRASLMAVQYNAYMNIIDCKRPNLGVQVFRVTDRMLYKILGYYNDPDYGDFTHPKHGFDLLIRREGVGRQTKYPEIRFRAKPSPIIYENWKEELHDLTEFAKVLPYEEVKAILLGQRSSSGSRLDEEE